MKIPDYLGMTREQLLAIDPATLTPECVPHFAVALQAVLHASPQSEASLLQRVITVDAKGAEKSRGLVVTNLRPGNIYFNAMTWKRFQTFIPVLEIAFASEADFNKVPLRPAKTS